MNYKINIALKNPIRLSDIDFTIFPEVISKNQWKKLIKSNHVYVNQNLGQTSTWINNLDEIEIKWENVIQKVTKVFPLKLEIAYEDDFLAVVVKPAGLPVSGNVFKSLQNALEFNLTKSIEMKTGDSFQTCHRLDFSTSGLVIISKTKQCRIDIGTMLENKSIQKKYYALVQGKPKVNNGIWNQIILDKACESHFNLVQSIPSIKNAFVSLLELSPITGRTHQLRIHCSKNNLPIIGDQKYGVLNNTLKNKGLFLFAFHINFIHPILKNEINITLDIPHKFNKLLHRESSNYLKYNS